MSAPLPAELVGILACPRCRGPLVSEERAFRCDACALRYHVDGDGIADFLIEHAEPVTSGDPEGAGG